MRNIKNNLHATLIMDFEGMPKRGALIYGRAQPDCENMLDKLAAAYEKNLPAGNAGKAARLAGKFKPVILGGTPTRMPSCGCGKEGLIR